ncbi:MAG: short-chain dehydrogenase/reductase [Bacilli bacterium]|nr:short-chain dehydrogenase/reductase [Bacilli bacterium]
MKQQNHQVVLITGAAKGIGRAIAEKFSRQGWTVVLVDMDLEHGQEFAHLLSQQGETQFFHGDIRDEQLLANLIVSIEQNYGRLDAIINNAGIGKFRPLEEVTLADFDEVLATNLRAPFWLAKLAAPLLRASCGSIVSISSTRALMSEPGNEAYAASKGALLSLTHALANSLGPCVRVNAICPGWIDTSGRPDLLRDIDHAAHPVGRVGMPEDIASAAYYLCCQEAGFITGQTLVVDGGMTKKLLYPE